MGEGGNCLIRAINQTSFMKLQVIAQGVAPEMATGVATPVAMALGSHVSLWLVKRAGALESMPHAVGAAWRGPLCSALPYSLSICGTVIICTCRYVYDWLRAPLGQVTGAERHPCSGSLPSQSAPLRCVASTRVGDSKTLSALTAPDSNPHQDVVYRRDG